jgi:hypothetical protein
MSAIDQLLYHVADDRHGKARLVAASDAHPARLDIWRGLESWLRAGHPPARGYLALGDTAILIRWMPGEFRRSPNGWAHVLVAPASVLTVQLALRVPEWDWSLDLRAGGRLPPLDSADLDTTADLGSAARSGRAAEQLVPLLARLLAGEMAISVPLVTRSQSDAVLWGLTEILQACGDDRSLSFVSSGQPPCPRGPGLTIMFSPAVAPEPIGPTYAQAAIGLATCYADSGAAALRRLLTEHQVLRPGGLAVTAHQLLDLWPGPGTPERPPGDVMTETGGGDVVCPVCLSGLTWSRQPLWRWDAGAGAYAELTIPPDATGPWRNRARRSASVRCPGEAGASTEHYLPADYGSFGKPVVLGFVGATRSGKSHLMTAMVGLIEAGNLSTFGVRSRPLDQALHQRFADEQVRPLLDEAKVLPATGEGVLSFVDAFVIEPPSGQPRAVALFDVAGGELTSVNDAKQFLELVDGLIFVIDPAELHGGPGDKTFSTVLNLLQSSGRLTQVSAALVLSKADMVRFDDPIARWLRCDADEINPDEITSESADVYAYLHSRGAQGWTRPYNECAKATLHVASPTGGAEQDGVYPRGVTPRRVLAPLVALLAMTGVLTGPDAQRVGI